jgi:hypothetical protein
MELTFANFDSVMRDVLLTNEELAASGLGDEAAANTPNPPGVILSHGAMTIFGFNEVRLQKQADNIRSMLSCLDDTFFAGKGGGWSLINAVQTKDGELWGNQPSADALFCLGQALGICKYCLPREFWSIMPGGMPYFIIDFDGFSEEAK